VAENTFGTQLAMTISVAAARLSFAGVATFRVLLAIPHVIKPGLEFSWHFVGDYAIGMYAWVMMARILFPGTCLRFSIGSSSVSNRGDRRQNRIGCALSGCSLPRRRPCLYLVDEGLHWTAPMIGRGENHFGVFGPRGMHIRKGP
jgi:hypothetical protein